MTEEELNRLEARAKVADQDSAIHMLCMSPSEALDLIRLAREVAELKHDLERYMTIANSEVAESERLRARLAEKEPHAPAHL